MRGVEGGTSVGKMGVPQGDPKVYLDESEDGNLKEINFQPHLGEEADGATNFHPDDPGGGVRKSSRDETWL